MYIYQTIDIIRNKFYIGLCTKSWEESESYFGSGRVLKDRMKKYGKDGLFKELLEIAKDIEELNQLEKYYIFLADAVKSDDYYNLSYGGIGRSRENMLGEKNSFYGKTHTKETKLKISKARKGKSNSKATEFKKGSTPHNKGKIHLPGELNGFYGKQHSEDSLDKMRSIPKSKWNEIYELRKSGISVLKIAKSYNCSYPVIYRIIKKIDPSILNESSRCKVTSKDFLTIKKYREEKMSYKEISKIYNCSETSIWRLMNKKNKNK